MVDHMSKSSTIIKNINGFCDHPDDPNSIDGSLEPHIHEDVVWPKTSPEHYSIQIKTGHGNRAPWWRRLSCTILYTKWTVRNDQWLKAATNSLVWLDKVEKLWLHITGTTRLKTAHCQHPHTPATSRAQFPAGGQQVWFMMGPPLFIIFTSCWCAITALRYSWGSSKAWEQSLYQVNQCRHGNGWDVPPDICSLHSRPWHRVNGVTDTVLT